MKRLFSALLSVALLLTLLPAAEAKSGAWDGSVDISWYDPGKSEYYLSTPAQLAGLAALVNGMADPTAAKITGDQSYLKSIRVDDVLLVGAGGGNVSDTVYTSDVDFAYKTVYLTADMDMGGRYDAASNTWSGPNWTPIGGKFPMKPQEASGDCLTLDTRFNGVLDGQGHTISNLYCERYAVKGFPYSMAVGFVGFLGGACDNNANVTADFENGWQPAVRNLVLSSGSIYGRRMVGGVVGRIGETSNGVVVENCANRASVRNTDSKGVGGIVGSAWGDGIIRNCYNTGTISTTYTCPAGGILGTNEGMDVYNCYNVGTVDTHGASYGRGIGGHDSGSYTVSNCYYLSGCDDDAGANGYYKGTSRKISVSCKALSASEMKSESLVRLLNANGAVFAADTSQKNGGYPVLWFESGSTEKTCTVSLAAVQNGTVTVSQIGAVTAGQIVDLRAEAEAGWLFDHFTVNGKPIEGAFYTVAEDCAFGAVFKKVRTAALSFAQTDGFYLAVRRTGWKYDDTGAMVYVTGEPVYSGETLLEGNVLTLLTHEYSAAQPSDGALEYRSGVLYTVANADKNADGSYTVTANGTVTITGVRNTRGKTWSSCADRSWYTGKQKSYTLTTAEQLAGLAALVNGGTDFSGVTVRLGADISLERDSASGAQRLWTPIGTSINRAFRGVFDGQNHKITGMRAYNDGSDSALFGCVSGAGIRDLTVCGSTEGKAAASYAAGVLAYADASVIQNCTAYVDVTAAGTHASGLAAYICNGTTVESCASYGAVSGASGVGGLVGVSYSGEDKIENCANFGAVTSTRSGTYGTGGLAGRLAGTITKSVNYGAVTSADRYTGGLAGYTTARNKTTVTLCRNEGSVSSSSTDERAATGSLVGYAQNLIWGGCEDAAGAEPIGKSGSVKETAVTGVIPTFTAGERPEDVPPPEEKTEQATGAELPLVENGAVKASGTYRIPWFSTGTITVGENLDVTLCGEESSFENLTLTVGSGTKLTLKNVSITGDRTLLKLAGGNVLTLSERNELDGRSDTPENENPTVTVGGDLTINGTGSLCVSAQVNNAAIYVSSGSTLHQNGGTLSIFKTDKLGFAGGAFYANGSTYELTGGTLCGRTDSDNVAVLSADSVTVTGGEIRVTAEKSPAALLGSVTLKDCTATAYGHSGNSAKMSAAYEGERAIPSLRSQSGVQWKELLPFTDVTAEKLWYDDVAFCYARGWMQGTGKDTFAPASSMTRAMFVTALYRAAGSPAVRSAVPFTDLKADWYKKAVAWAAETGVVQGTSKTTFSPDDVLTVEQAAVLMQRYLKDKLTADANAALPESAGAVSSWARDGVAWAYGARLLEKDDLSAPAEAAGRVLLAQLLHRSMS